VTLGLVDFKPRDVLETGLPENFDTLGFTPGIEFDIELTPHWHLLPFAEIGRAVELDGGNDATVYSFGAHAAASTELGSVLVRFDFGATYAGVEPDGGPRSDDILLLETGIEGRRAFARELGGHPFDWGAYLLADYFVNRASVPLEEQTESANRLQFEIGVTVGPRGELKIWRMPVPRIGVGYRMKTRVWRRLRPTVRRGRSLRPPSRLCSRSACACASSAVMSPAGSVTCHQRFSRAHQNTARRGIPFAVCVVAPYVQVPRKDWGLSSCLRSSL
jgi:hypothetical protein